MYYLSSVYLTSQEQYKSNRLVLFLCLVPCIIPSILLVIASCQLSVTLSLCFPCSLLVLSNMLNHIPLKSVLKPVVCFPYPPRTNVLPVLSNTQTAIKYCFNYICFIHTSIYSMILNTCMWNGVKALMCWHFLYLFWCFLILSNNIKYL